MKKCNIYVNSLLLFENIKIADNFFLRFKGLMGETQLKNYSGLLISPCNQIHTFFMKMNIDVIFIDKDMQIVKTIQNAQKSKIYPAVKKSAAVLELEPGIIKKYGLNVGDNIKVNIL